MPDDDKTRTGGVRASNIVASNVVSGTQIHIGGSQNIVARGDHNVVVHERKKDLPTISRDQAFERIGAAVRLNLHQLQGNIEQARTESNQFFRLTLVFCALGFFVVLGGVVFLLVGQVTAGVVTTIASLIPELTAGLFYTKDRELRKTVQAYHQHMLDSQQLLTMIDVAETIAGQEERDRMKQEIIFKVLEIQSPMANNMGAQQAGRGDAEDRAPRP